MKKVLNFFGITFLLVVFLASCPQSASITQAPPETQEERLRLTLAEKDMIVNDTQQLKVILIATDGVQDNYTEKVRYTASPSSVVKVDAKGLVTALRVGEASITASYGGKTSNKVTVQVERRPDPQEESLELTLTKESMTLNDTQQLNVILTSDGVQYNYTEKVGYTASPSSVVNVDAKGLVTALRVGEASITASYDGKTSNQVTVQVVSNSVTPETQIKSIEISVNNNASISFGDTRQLTATATTTSGNKIDYTEKVTWSTLQTAYIGISAQGVITVTKQPDEEVDIFISAEKDSLQSNELTLKLAGESGKTIASRKGVYSLSGINEVVHVLRIFPSGKITLSSSWWMNSSIVSDTYNRTISPTSTDTSITLTAGSQTAKLDFKSNDTVFVSSSRNDNEAHILTKTTDDPGGSGDLTVPINITKDMIRYRVKIVGEKLDGVGGQGNYPVMSGGFLEKGATTWEAVSIGKSYSESLVFDVDAMERELQKHVAESLLASSNKLSGRMTAVVSFKDTGRDVNSGYWDYPYVRFTVTYHAVGGNILSADVSDTILKLVLDDAHTLRKF